MRAGCRSAPSGGRAKSGWNVVLVCCLGSWQASCETLEVTASLPDAQPVPVAETDSERFSFFVTSLVAMQRLSGSLQGFGGDLRFGESGAGAGLRGADKICATIAESSLAGASRRTWRAF